MAFYDSIFNLININVVFLVGLMLFMTMWAGITGIIVYVYMFLYDKQAVIFELTGRTPSIKYARFREVKRNGKPTIYVSLWPNKIKLERLDPTLCCLKRGRPYILLSKTGDDYTQVGYDPSKIMAIDFKHEYRTRALYASEILEIDKEFETGNVITRNLPVILNVGLSVLLVFTIIITLKWSQDVLANAGSVLSSVTDKIAVAFRNVPPPPVG